MVGRLAHPARERFQQSSGVNGGARREAGCAAKRGTSAAEPQIRRRNDDAGTGVGCVVRDEPRPFSLVAHHVLHSIFPSRASLPARIPLASPAARPTACSGTIENWGGTDPAV